MLLKIPLIKSYFEDLPIIVWSDVKDKDEIGKGSFEMENWKWGNFFYTPHFPHSAFSTLRIFYTPHFLHSAFSTLRTFHTPHFLHSALRTPHSAYSTEWSARFKFVSGEFSTCFAEIWRERCPIIRQKKRCWGIFIFCFFKKLWINSQSLTACQKQTRQVIKIFRHRFLKKAVKKR